MYVYRCAGLRRYLPCGSVQRKKVVVSQRKPLYLHEP